MKFKNEKYKNLTINTKKKVRKIMNFYEMQQKISGPENKQNILYNKPTIEKSEYINVMRRIEKKLGVKSNKYTPLIRFVSRNQDMLRLLEELVEETSTTQASKMNQIFKNH